MRGAIVHEHQYVTILMFHFVVEYVQIFSEDRSCHPSMLIVPINDKSF